MEGPDKRRRGRPRRASDGKGRRRRQLNRDSPVPCYFQLGAALREILLTEDWAAGSQFLTEREIGEDFGVSRTVIRRALGLLVSDGMIELRRGAGAFVTAPRRRLHPLGLVRALSEKPEGLRIEIKTAREETAKNGVVRLLGISPSSRVAHVTATFSLHGEPVCLLDSYSRVDVVRWLLPAVRALEQGRASRSPAGLLLAEAEIEIELSFFSTWGGPQLGATPGDPTLIGQLIQSGRAPDGDEEVRIEFAHLIFRPDRVRLDFRG